jgi:hypothetical protein
MKVTPHGSTVPKYYSIQVADLNAHEKSRYAFLLGSVGITPANLATPRATDERHPSGDLIGYGRQTLGQHR